MGSGWMLIMAPSDLGVQLFIFKASERDTLKLESKKWDRKGIRVFVSFRFGCSGGFCVSYSSLSPDWGLYIPRVSLSGKGT